MVRSSPSNSRPRVYHSILSPDALAEIVQAEYGLPQPVECSLLNSGVNEIYRVVSQRDQYILRLARVERNGPIQESACRFELELLDWLRAQGAPVAYPIRRASGDSLGAVDAPEGQRYYALFSFADGKPVSSPDTQQAHLLGEILAQLHRSADEFSPTHSGSRLDQEYLIDGPLRRLRLFPGISIADRDVLEQSAESLRARIRRIPAQAGEFGVIHGDFWWKNALFADGKAVLIDFEFCGYGYRAYDVASFSGTAKLFGSPLPPEVVDAFLSGYRSIRELSEDELAAIPAFEQIRMIWACGLWTGFVNVLGTRWFFENFDLALSNLRRCRDEEPGKSSAR